MANLAPARVEATGDRAVRADVQDAGLKSTYTGG